MKTIILFGLACVALAGCTDDPAALHHTAVDQAPGSSADQLELVAVHPLPGQAFEIRLVNAPPSGTARLWVSLAGRGDGPCAPGGSPCADIVQVRELGTATIDANGGVTAFVVAPPAAFPTVGSTAYFQAIVRDPATGEYDTSSVLEQTWHDSDFDAIFDGADACVSPLADLDADGICDDIDTCVGPPSTCGCPAATSDGVYLFHATGSGPQVPRTAQYGGREGLNGYARAAWTHGATTNALQVAAFVGSTGDALADLPNNHCVPTDRPVFGIDASGATTLLANDWADLMDGTIQTTIGAALGYADFLYFWTGSDASGQPTGQDCGGWTSPFGNATISGRSNTTTDWLDSGFTSAVCSSTYELLGIAW